MSARPKSGRSDPDRLARFIAALPPWIPPSFDSFSPDEASRRMTFAYRLVFPDGQEIGATAKAVGGASKGRGTAAPEARRAAQGEAQDGRGRGRAGAVLTTEAGRPMAWSRADIDWMHRALAEAEKGRGVVEPNPDGRRGDRP